jgi:methyl-accepting chemotaxis protein
MDPNTTSAIRDIFVMLAAGAFAVLCLTFGVLIIKLYRPLRDAVNNGAKTAESLSLITGNLASVSEETASNIVHTSRNAVSITDNLKEGSEEIPSVVRSAGEAAKSASAAAGTVATVADSVRRLTSLGLTGGASAPVGSLLRLVRNMFGSSRRSDDGGVQQGA